MSTQLTWSICSFQEMDIDTFHDVLKLRIDVFVIEQDCPYDELDGKDRSAVHVIGRNTKGDVIAYSRLLDANEKRPPAIGRVVVHEDARGTGIGHEMLRVCLSELERSKGTKHSFLSAQEHLQKFYGMHGYRTVSEVYDLDGIPHVNMILDPNESS